jgi:phosphoenolpyruvate phosphomutase
MLGAHDGLSARIVEEAGFKAIWASGLSISASMGVRDSNEASWTQVLETVEFMSDATSIPILLDGDTGYGNFNNARRLVSKLEQRNVAGVCFEDKTFPKTNSLINNRNHDLVRIDDFVGKIRASKDIQKDSDFCVVARTEAFVAGLGLAEALKRAKAYSNAGADAILVHSIHSTQMEISSFMNEWDRRCPVIIVPTRYASVHTSTFEQIGVSIIIWANYLLRASIKQMQKVASDIFKCRTPQPTESNIVSLDEVFRLQGLEELLEAEKRYVLNPQNFSGDGSKR